MGIFSEIGLRYSSESAIKRALSAGKYLALLYRSSLIRQVEMKGVFRGEKQPRSLVYLGEGESLSYFRKLCFANLQGQKESRCCPHQIDRIQRSLPDEVIVVTEVNRLLAGLVKGCGYPGYPWLLQKVFISSEGYLDRKAHILNKRGLRVRKRHYRYDTVTDRSSIETFYQSFYRPYILERFGGMAHLRSVRNFLAALHHGFLLRVFDEDKWVAGMVCLRRGREVVSLGSAVLVEETDHLKKGALTAAYYYLFQWAEEHGMEVVNLLRSRPHLDDGVFSHKSLWGAVPRRDPWPHTCYTIRIPVGNPPPGILGNQLVWDGSSFMSLKNAAEKAVM